RDAADDAGRERGAMPARRARAVRMIDGNTVGVATPLLMQGGTLTDVSSPDAGAGYPRGRSARDRFVLARRGSRPFHDAWRHQGVLVEPERAADGRIATTATVFLT